MKKIIVPILVLLFMSCQEDDLKPTDVTASVVETLNEYELANRVFQDVGNNAGDAVLKAESSNTAKISGSKEDPVIHVEPANLTEFPKTITVDFGTGILCKDGVTRKGIVKIVSTGWYGALGSEHTTTFDGYYHEGYKVEGAHVVKNLGENEDGELKYSVTINDGKITDGNDHSVQYKENSFRTWVAGADTPLNIWDDEYLLDGTQSGMSSRGVAYTLTIEESLHFVLLPRSITSGILDLDIGQIKNIKLNFNNATVTILGNTYPWGIK
ncbi:hypothetical protein KFZ70_11620 [Tamlana fucoidanivorans]|uniref:Lipoprotein n=1 Tax=Allotamlana fucoidanivorans TaxID=2583814 RepID=A0A5C4SHQ4_9FLAO|nr:hypothetical protein [Tamlana fucoidanivorans]TNJ43083.1 hypothetical protein FGF67_12020 [Tamlana fucoidanivorans]